jgi:uncharacterized protein
VNLVLKLSKLCNLRCTYCYEYEHLADPARMPLDGLAYFLAGLGEYLARLPAPPALEFALHGGEPLLLPADYLRAVVGLQREHLGRHSIAFRNSVQTNLYRVPDERLELLAELEMGLGVSLDVHGGARVDAQGRDAEARVQTQLRSLLASPLGRRLRVGGISVLHAGNWERAADTYAFFAGLELDYRILPIFSMHEPAARLRPLMLQPAQVVQALQAVQRAQLGWRGARQIRVYPLDDYLQAALAQLAGHAPPPPAPADLEWALIINTDGRVYTHAEAYVEGQALGQAFSEPVASWLHGPVRARLQQERAARAAVCRACEAGDHCSRLPMTEALPSERTRDAQGQLVCAVARPMIAQLRALVAQTPAAHRRIQALRG